MNFFFVPAPRGYSLNARNAHDASFRKHSLVATMAASVIERPGPR
jgi:hypothetical protein